MFIEKSLAEPLLGLGSLGPALSEAERGSPHGMLADCLISRYGHLARSRVGIQSPGRES
jgi:hypothetical protein